MSHQKGLEAWVISAAGPDCARRFEAPVQVPGWDCPPWVELRPLTERERLERESLGVCDEYHLDAAGNVEQVVRRYDAVAMARYDYEHCLVAFCLPRRSTPADLIKWRKPEDFSANELLDLLPPALVEWLNGAIDEVNLRRPADQQMLAEVKKTSQRGAPARPGPVGADERLVGGGDRGRCDAHTARGVRLSQPATAPATSASRRSNAKRSGESSEFGRSTQR